MLWLLVFLSVAVAIQARQASAAGLARRVGKLSQDRTALEAERSALERQLRIATGRKELVDRAERELGLHLPASSEMRFVTRPRNRR
jgi:cell division protein FtsB